MNQSDRRIERWNDGTTVDVRGRIIVSNLEAVNTLVPQCSYYLKIEMNFYVIKKRETGF